MNKRIIIGVVGILAVVALSVGCDSMNPPSSNQKDQNVSQSILDGYQKAQPVPVKPWSQLRQNLIEIESSQADTTQTTSFFFNQGVPDPLISCPSIGFPIPSTYQLTNPEQVINKGQYDNGSVVIPQIEANGVFTGDTSGTYVICIDATGKPYASYWEGFVNTVTGPAVWDKDAKTVKLTGPPSFDFTKEKAK